MEGLRTRTLIPGRDSENRPQERRSACNRQPCHSHTFFCIRVAMMGMFLIALFCQCQCLLGSAKTTPTYPISIVVGIVVGPVFLHPCENSVITAYRIQNDPRGLLPWYISDDLTAYSSSGSKMWSNCSRGDAFTSARATTGFVRVRTLPFASTASAVTSRSPFTEKSRSSA